MDGSGKGVIVLQREHPTFLNSQRENNFDRRSPFDLACKDIITCQDNKKWDAPYCKRLKNIRLHGSSKVNTVVKNIEMKTQAFIIINAWVDRVEQLVIDRD